MTNFPELRTELQRLAGKLSKSLPGPVTSFGGLHKSAMAEGALSAKNKELIALGISIALRCDGCVSYHVSGALKTGASREEVLETIGVAIMMGGGPGMIYACEAFAALEQFEQQQQAS